MSRPGLRVASYLCDYDRQTLGRGVTRYVDGVVQEHTIVVRKSGRAARWLIDIELAGEGDAVLDRPVDLRTGMHVTIRDSRPDFETREEYDERTNLEQFFDMEGLPT